MKKSTIILPAVLALFFISFTLTGCPTQHECSKEPHSRAHPFVFWDPADLDAVRNKIAEGSPDRDWALPVYNGILNSAQSWLAADITVPDEGGGWSHEFVCPDHGVTLVYDPSEPYSHLCPSGGEVWTGEPYYSAWRCHRHSSLAGAVKTLGLAGLLAEDDATREACALRVRELLLAYADLYLTYTIDDRWGGTFLTGARAYAQTLSESVWLLQLVAGYDSIYDSGVLSPEEKGRIEDDLLCASVNTILRYDAAKSNWQAWHNAALGAVGFLLEDDWLIDQALYGWHGFTFHMDQSVLDDGIWFEGALSYHYYTMSAYLQLAEAAWRSGIDLYENSAWQRMHDAPVNTLFPNLEFPRINDVSSTYDSIRSRANFYEVSNTRWNRDRDSWVLDRIYDAGTSRSSREALLYGSQIDTTVPYELASANLEPSGLGVLRAGSGAQVLYALMDYGPHGGGHGHYDKLGLVLYRDRELLPDLGTVKYSLPEYEGWYKKSVAHNTLMMGEKNQVAGGEETRPVDYFGTPGPDLQVLQASVGTEVFFPSGSATRTLLMVRDDYLLDVVSAAGIESPCDLVYHPDADALATTGGLLFSDVPAELSTRWSNSPNGHAYLEGPSSLDGSSYDEIQQASVPGAWGALLTRTGSATGLHLLAAGNEPTTVITADAPGNPLTERHPVLLLRREGVSSTRYVAVLEPYQGAPQVESVTVDGNVVEIRFGSETHRITVDQAGRAYSLEITE